LPGLLSETDWALLKVPTIWPTKVRFDADNEAIGAAPVPVSATDWGLSTPLSVIFTAPTMIPVAVGAKLTEIVQLVPTPSDAGQLLVTEKSPVASMLLIWRGAFPELFKVKLCGELVVFTRWLPKARLEVEGPATGLATPVPLKLTVCGLESALSAMVRTPVRVPAAVGAKVTEMVHCAPAARLGTQLSVSAKSPLAVTLTLRAAPPEFNSVTVAPALVVPTFCGAKLKVVGETQAAGSPIPMPWTGTFCELPEALSLIVRTPLASPLAVGEKNTLKAQLDPGARVAGQSFATLNASLAVAPEIASGAPLGLLMVTVAGALVVPTPCPPKSNLAG